MNKEVKETVDKAFTDFFSFNGGDWDWISEHCSAAADIIKDVATLAVLKATEEENERVRKLEGIASKIINWEDRYPTSRIFSTGEIRIIAAEMTAIVNEAREVIKGAQER